MGGGRQKKLSSFSLFGMFKSSSKPRRGSAGEVDDPDQATSSTSSSNGRKVWPSDEDYKGRWVADPNINLKATAFISKFHETRVSESETQIYHHALNH
ncbi:hypothetical protein HS088_TW12G01145 [Tripterygium wilfordii]|uniref:Uncharacterized protein n=1 Tax=Tripterygium wilfordii TaxID=458696 RepID=A0A7J7D0R9_TRIWF|nr:uncharacterized protein LOC120011530 [Tripterygium wilfordii]KAF5739931.1 hypothetical protein HS088_TW12G01145 [Tripterygium wilfordii]